LHFSLGSWATSFGSKSKLARQKTQKTQQSF